MSVKTVPFVPYSSARPNIATGDAVLWKGNSLIARLIQMWTPFNHASLIVRLQQYDNLKNRVFLVEALGTGLELRLLSKRLEAYDGEVYWLHVESSDDQRSFIIDFALTNCASGISYDYGSLIKNMFGRVSADAGRYFCSEFVFDTWVQVGLAVYPHIATAPRPGDLPKWVKGVLVRIK